MASGIATSMMMPVVNNYPQVGHLSNEISSGGAANVVDDVVENISGEVSGSINKTPSEVARSWQGSELYPGVDSYSDIYLHKGDEIYILESDYEVINKCHSGYATTQEAVFNSGYDARKLSEGLQIKPYLDETAEEIAEFAEYRSRVTKYTVQSDSLFVAYGEETLANLQYGRGGNPQYFINNIESEIESGNLVRGESFDLSNYKITCDDYFDMITQARSTFLNKN